MKKILYLCVPYSHPDTQVREYRAMRADKEAARLMEQGLIVFSPISHSHRIAPNIGNVNKTKFWIEQDTPFLKMADIVAVLTLPGWEESFGIEVELNIARKLGKHIIYIENEQFAGQLGEAE